MLVLLSGGFLYLAALFAPPRGVEFVLLGAGYEQNLSVPHNLYGWNSLADLASAIGDGTHRSYWAQHFWHVKPQPQRLLLETRLAEIAPQSRARTWVLFVSAHGGVDDQGMYLLADNDLSPQQPERRQRISHLLAHVKKLPPEQHKVLVFDTVHFECDVTLGMLENDFALKLRQLDAEIREIPNLVVVCASDVNELAWDCPMWGRTTFAHFWIEGLRGAAIDLDDSGRINVTELLAFTSAQTSHWVHTHYRARQTPWLLPTGAEGQRRAKRIDLCWKDDAYEPSTPTLVAPTAVPPNLKSYWQTAADLAAQPIPPYVYQPQTWRRYLTTLERYEKLTMAGETHAAERLASQLQSLALACQHDPTQLLSSLDTQRSSSAFAQPANPRLRSQAQDVFLQLSRSPPDQWAAKWKECYTAAGKGGKPLRSEVLQLLVDQAISDPIDRLNAVRHVAEIVRDPLQPHCPALHLAVMMERDLPADARTLAAAPLLARAIRVRQLAEQSTTGDILGFTQESPRVRPWVAARVAAADALRQQAEDLLFTGVEQHAEAADRFAQAESLYLEAISDGRAVLEAYGVRDRALATLPDLSHGVLGFPRECAAGHPALAKLESQLHAAWHEAHQLNHLLASAPILDTSRFRGDDSANNPAEQLKAAAERVAARLDDVDQQLAALWHELGSDKFTGERLCLTHVPALPSLDTEVRCAALAHSLQYVHRRREDLTQLLTLSAVGRNYAAAAKSPDQQVITPAMQNCAARRAELGLAMLGTSWFERLGREGNDTWTEAQHRLSVFRVDPDWRTALAALADQLALRWRRMPQLIQQDQVEGSDTEGQVRALIEADQLGRNLPRQFYGDLDNEASDHLRARRLAAYLAWQAERTWRDHWYGQHDDETPYYALRARALLADAQRVAPQPQLFRDLATRLAVTDDWRLDLPARAAITPEESLTLAARVVPGQETLTGYLAVKVDYGPGLVQRKSVARAWPWPAQRETQTMSLEADVADHSVYTQRTTAPSKVTLIAYYRGRRATKSVAVDLHGTPEVALVDPLAPTYATIAVEASPELAQRFGRGHGAVAIVLDCSGSMGSKAGQPFDEHTRYAQATQALATVLAGLPRGSEVSIWTFGQAHGAKKTVAKAEETVRCLRPLSPWNPEDKQAYQALMSSLAYPALEPWNESAVVHAMLAAKQELVSSRGPKTLIAITDGIDNRYQQDVQVNPQHWDVSTGLAESFRGTGIALQVVGFQIASHEEEEAHKQFNVIESFDPPGRFYKVEEASELLAALNAALDRRLRYWIEDYDHRPLANESNEGWQPVFATAALPRDRASARPGEYRLRAVADRPIERALIVSGGDLVLGRLQSDQDQVTIERGRVLPRLYPHARVEQAGAWSAGLLASALQGQRATVTVALEREPDSRELQLAVVAPARIWWQMTLDADEEQASALRATRVFTSGLPTWQLECDAPGELSLPAATTARVEAWWLEGATALPSVSLVCGRDFTHVEELVGRTLNVGGMALTIRDVRWQTTEAGRRLIVVVEGAGEAECRVTLHGLGEVAAEHRHYQSLGRYAALFDCPPGDNSATDWRLEFESLAALKQLATQQGTHHQFKNVLLQRTAAPQP